MTDLKILIIYILLQVAFSSVMKILCFSTKNSQKPMKI